MAGKIKFDEGKHAQLVSTLDEVQSSFTEIMTALKNTKSTVDSDFKGTAADALKTALQGKLDQLKKEKESWHTVIRNANEIKSALVTADTNSKKIIQGPSLPSKKTPPSSTKSGHSLGMGSWF